MQRKHTANVFRDLPDLIYRMLSQVSSMRSRHPSTEALRLWTQAIAQRRGQRIAIVALGRKLAGVLFAMWRDGTAFGEKSVTTSRASAQVA